VLVVEDNAVNRDLMEQMLRVEGHSVDVARDGFAGVRMAAEKCYDLILMDISMPSLNGMRATEMIRASGQSQQTPIYAVTAHALPQEQAHFAAIGMTGCLAKPVRRQELRALLSGVARDQEQAPAPILLNSDGPEDAAELPLLDPKHLAEMRSLTGDEKLEAQVARLEAEASETCARVAAHSARGLENGEALSAVQDEVHRLAGSCATFGAVRLRDRLQRLESACKDGDAASVRRHGDLLPDLWHQTREKLRASLSAGEPIAAQIDGPVETQVEAVEGGLASQRIRSGR
jgi:CheY-like chemotaxis protein/HPt (histidine-containing phosphotransfer) domain-containing protein